MSDPKFVECPECGYEQGDMGKGVQCEECGYGPMPTLDEEDDVGREEGDEHA